MIHYFSHELADLFMKGKAVQFKKGDIILEPGYPSQDIYYVEAGYVKTYVLTQDGNTHLHVIYRPKKIFPLRSAILDLQGNSFYEAMTDVTVRKLPKDTFVQALESNHSLAMILLKKVTAMFDDYVYKVDNLQFKSTHHRLVSMLIYLIEGFSEKEGEDVIVNIPLTHQDLANLCGMARETVSRELETLKQKGIIEHENHHIVIKDLKKLEQELTS